MLWSLQAFWFVTASSVIDSVAPLKVRVPLTAPTAAAMVVPLVSSAAPEPATPLPLNENHAALQPGAPKTSCAEPAGVFRSSVLIVPVTLAVRTEKLFGLSTLTGKATLLPG